MCFELVEQLYTPHDALYSAKQETWKYHYSVLVLIKELIKKKKKRKYRRLKHRGIIE